MSLQFPAIGIAASDLLFVNGYSVVGDPSPNTIAATLWKIYRHEEIDSINNTTTKQQNEKKQTWLDGGNRELLEHSSEYLLAFLIRNLDEEEGTMEVILIVADLCLTMLRFHGEGRDMSKLNMKVTCQEFLC